MLEKMKTQEEVHVVTDQRGKPTYVDDLAAVLLKALNWSGIYHVADSGEVSRFQFAEAIREEALAQGVPLLCKRIIPVLSAEFPTAAKRPPYSVLNTEKAEKKLNASLPSWKEGLKQMVAGV
jgi:dTDP-4-dehydrorhamnose reductase